MKKTIIILLLSAVLISACSVFGGGQDPTPLPPTPSPMPTAVLDPCAPENLKEELQPLVDLINVYRDTAFVASIADKTFMVFPLLELQKNRRDVQNFEVPDCQIPVKAAALEYMVASINVFAALATADTDEQFQAAADAYTSVEESLWQNVLFQVKTLLLEAGLVDEPQTSPSNSPETNEIISISISNESSAGINVRGLPDINSEILTTLEPGMQAIGIARNEGGDWVQINLDGVIGWVFTETITASAPVEDLPLFEAVQ